jgi:Cu-processing system ATP-binding protein
MIEFRNVTKRFGKTVALQGVSFTCRAGSAVAILGPNASGKTTLLKCLLGLTRPDQGEILVGGAPVTDSPDYRRRLGYMPQQPRFPDNLLVSEVIELIKRVRGIPTAAEVPYVEQFNLEAELQKPIRALSGGTRQKLSAVIALMGDPEILVLDEPTAGLDPMAAHVLKDELRARRNRGCTVLLTTHVLADVPELVDTVVFLLEGRIAFREEVATMLSADNTRSFEQILVERLQQ